MRERDCPKCGYGIMEMVSVVVVSGGWEESSEAPLQTQQQQKNVWRCIDCLFEMENGHGEDTSK